VLRLGRGNPDFSRFTQSYQKNPFLFGFCDPLRRDFQAVPRKQILYQGRRMAIGEEQTD
jgi:hypothetical protein